MFLPSKAHLPKRLSKLQERSDISYSNEVLSPRLLRRLARHSLEGNDLETFPLHLPGPVEYMHTAPS